MSTGEREFCAKCGGSQETAWCPAWQVWLCPHHVHEATWRELDATQRPDGWVTAQAREVAVVTL